MEECKQHPWWPGDGYGKKGLRIVKAIRFHNPIHNVRGKVEGFPKRVAVCNWLGDDVQCEDEVQKIERGRTLFKEIDREEQLRRYL